MATYIMDVIRTKTLGDEYIKRLHENWMQDSDSDRLDISFNEFVWTKIDIRIKSLLKNKE